MEFTVVIDIKVRPDIEAEGMEVVRRTNVAVRQAIEDAMKTKTNPHREDVGITEFEVVRVKDKRIG